MSHMNEEQQRQSADEQADEQMPDLNLIFAPSWARQSPEEIARQTTARQARGGADSHDRPHTRSSDRDRIRSPRPQPRGDTMPRTADPGGRPPRREGGFGDARGPQRGGPQRGPRPEGRDEARASSFAPRPEPQKPLALDIRFLPEQKALGTIIRRIQTTRRAYPVRDIVRLFQNSDEGMLVRIEAAKESATPQPLFQCRVCGMPALSDEEVRSHLLRQHMEDFFEVEEVEGEAPAGNFSCVARCGLSGEILGPPNHHSFGLRVQKCCASAIPP